MYTKPHPSAFLIEILCKQNAYIFLFIELFLTLLSHLKEITRRDENNIQLGKSKYKNFKKNYLVKMHISYCLITHVIECKLA